MLLCSLNRVSKIIFEHLDQRWADQSPPLGDLEGNEPEWNYELIQDLDDEEFWDRKYKELEILQEITRTLYCPESIMLMDSLF